jgi:hypothetical protein
MSNGKWNHMMDQTHIGYTYWQQPDKNAMPGVDYVQLPDSAEMGIEIEGLTSWWSNETREALLPEFDSYTKTSHYIELYNRGIKPFSYHVHASVPWIKINSQNGEIKKQQRVWLQVDWGKTPEGTHKIPITITGPAGNVFTVLAVVKNYGSSKKTSFKGFVETNGYVSMEASHYTRAINRPPVSWMLIPDIGRTGSGMTIMPVTAKREMPRPESPRLEYNLFITDTGSITVQNYFSPTLNFNGSELQYALSLDDELPQIMNLHSDNSKSAWEQWVANNIIIDSLDLYIKKEGTHVLKFWMVDPGIVLQKIVVGLHTVKPSYLGPPETLIK